MSPPTQGEPAALSDDELDRVAAGRVRVSIVGPTISPTITVQTNIATQVATAVLSAASITQIVGQVNLG